MATVISTTLIVKSNAFKNNGFIPVKFTCDGADINPEISITDIPMTAESLAIIVDDPDAPSGNFTHWVMWNIAPTAVIKEDSAPGIQGKNSFGENKYGGPCPPSGTHHYHFKIYALDVKLNSLPPSTDKKELEAAMKNHIVGKGEIIGLYKR